MSSFKRIVIEIIRRPFRTIILFLVIAMFTIFSVYGVFLREVVDTAYKEFVRMEGYSIGINSDLGEEIPESLYESILQIEHVIGYNAETLEYEYQPINFVNTGYNEDEISQNSQEKIIICGNIETSMNSKFRNQEMQLIEGNYPDGMSNGVIIDELLASENGLEIGDDIELLNENNNSKITLNVVGIYKTNVVPEQEINVGGQTYYIESTQSYLFCDFHTCFSIRNESGKITMLTFYIDEYDNIESVYQSMKSMPELKDYTVVNRLKAELSIYGKVFDTMSQLSSKFLIFVYITSLIVLLMMTVLWMRDHSYETGIYIALGTSKRKIVTYYILEILLIAIVASLGAGLLGYEILSKHNSSFVQLALDFNGTSISVPSIKNKVLNTEVSLNLLFKPILSYVLLVVATGAISSIVIANYDPRRLFEER